eukprot:CCRYP_000244-RD/>CCRYP_000244-RD protein AED:0.08 eAED:0.08 QI:148/1/1/1/0.86/0.87/16/1290/1209
MSEGHEAAEGNDALGDAKSPPEDDNGPPNPTAEANHVRFTLPTDETPMPAAPTGPVGSLSNPARSSSSSSLLDADRPAVPRRQSEAHMNALVRARRVSMKHLFHDEPVDEEEPPEDHARQESLKRKMMLEQHSGFIRKVQAHFEQSGHVGDSLRQRCSMEIRLVDVTYRVPTSNEEEKKIQTIYNSSPLYKIQKLFQRRGKKDKESTEWRNVLTSVNLVLKPQHMYLVLGPPLSGKTSLLKAIAGMLSATNKAGGPILTGSVQYNNVTVLGEGEESFAFGNHKKLFQNLVAFVRQNDAHAPRLTVDETFSFAANCKDPKEEKMGHESTRVDLTLDALGLTHVRDTFVGDEAVRGVSGGQRRRVTLGEMLVFDTPLLCGDEISTGLDTASTVDILSILSYVSRLFHRVTVVSLLQPSPEAVSLFDEIILLGEGGTVLFTGPTEDARDYFVKLGYIQPDGMDDADFLLAVASSDRHLLYRPDEKVEEGKHEVVASGDGTVEEVYTTEILGEKFIASVYSEKIKENQGMDWKVDWSKSGKVSIDALEKKYQRSFLTSVWLNMKRAFILWRRDRVFIRASAIKNVAMGISVGAVFFNTDVNSSFFGVLFQGNLFIMLGAMTSAPEKINDRAIFYKHDDSNFYPAASYILGQSLALVPQMMMDVLLFGTIVYWMVGFTASAGSFILYLVLFFSFNFTMGQLFGFLASVAPSKTVVQGGGAVILLLNTLFCGYIVSPTVIPSYFIWIYWCMPLAWVYRALLLNEYTSADYADGVGDSVLESFGFMYNGEPFTREWIWYCFAYIVPFLILCMVASAIGLHYYRVEPKQSTPYMPESMETKKEDDAAKDSLQDAPFTPVNLTFNNLCYEVKSSVGQERVRLLNNVSGMFTSGRMCALMGESGAGKTTLMDVIALRKRSGTITGEILLNGFPQNNVSFRRCSGYVEQFDVQSAELTVRETIRFSAILRLDRSNPVFATPDGLNKHIDHVIDMLELTHEAEILVGNAEEGGLSFEQKKRLSIAVELAASPSILFLDEPTSGLDARAALLVMNALRKIVSTGRTVVATIHQPSSTVFDMFDDLLLLKKGGEVVFYGELGHCSSDLIEYFESLGVSPMNKGENPATWMLNVLGEKVTIRGDNGQEAPLDFAYAWAQSTKCKELQAKLAEISETRDTALEIVHETEFAASKRQRDNLMANRLVTIYWRSPAYNLNRMVSSIF